eukprot:7778683-Prorocentrum_lima.AAC.1
MESGDGLDISSVYVAPARQEELQGLIKHVREPGIANTAEEALRMLRQWGTAHNRGQHIWGTSTG